MRTIKTRACLAPRRLSLAMVTVLSATLAAQSTTAAGAKVGSAPVQGTSLRSLALTSLGALTAVWANDGGEKVAQEELRVRDGGRRVLNSVWNGSKITLFAARNEVVAFNLVMEAANASAAGVTVRLDRLTGPNGFTIQNSAVASPVGVFNWTKRDIELFHVRYLKIQGLSRLSYDTYDERHIPERFRRPLGVDGRPMGGWLNRPDHDKSYPDIAVPIELVPGFTVAAGTSQSVWADVYVPKSAPAGLYTGTVLVQVGSSLAYQVPVELTVRDFVLPDMPNSKTMVATSYGEVARRYTGNEYPDPASAEDTLVKQVMTRQMLVAHRHKISLIDDNAGANSWTQDAPRPEWVPRLDGSLFTAANGYNGPGVGVGNNVFSITTYGFWRSLWGERRKAVWTHTDRWETWFQQKSPATERFLYLIDESTNYTQTEKWASWVRQNSGPGKAMKTFATANLVKALPVMPSVDIIASWIAVGDTPKWDSALATLRSDPRKKFFAYNGQRPASGSFAIEDDGVALRELPWGQYKKGISRWFSWNATYYNDYQGGRGDTDVFTNAQVFGGTPKPDPILGLTGWNYTTGDGVLFYPGTDRKFPAQSYNLAGPIASLRLKQWRRGIQDVDYITLAAARNPAAAQSVVERMVPKVMWENGVNDPTDPTWVLAPISWSTDPDDWEMARAELARIIETGQ